MSTRIHTKTNIIASTHCDSGFHENAYDAISGGDNYSTEINIETCITVTIKCDRDGKQLVSACNLDGQPSGRHAYDENEIAVDRAERLARRLDWAMSRTGDDLCPACSKEVRV